MQHRVRSNGLLYHFCPFQEVRPSLIEVNIQRGITKRELDELRRSYIQETGFTNNGIRECEQWRLYKTSINVIKHLRDELSLQTITCS